MNIFTALLCMLPVLVPFEKDGKWGYRDGSARVVISPRYEVAQGFTPEGIAAVVDQNGWAYIDAGGRVVIRPLVVDNGPDEFSESLARFRQGGKVGFFDTRGKVAIPPRFSFAMPFSQGRAAVCDGCVERKEGEHLAIRRGRWGYIDSRGDLIIPQQFEQAEAFRNGRARVRLGGAWRLIDMTGRPDARGVNAK
ncbi:MAG: WG repeat-containing protein [Candidatus Solibacter sp.]|nr:WG repeat-containing protein [Candidatus Solibacter sp.]